MSSGIGKKTGRHCKAADRKREKCAGRIAAGSDNCLPDNYEESSLRYFMLTERRFDRSMEPRIIEVEYAAEKETPAPHEGEEFLYVLEGEIVLSYGEEKFNLKKGDSIYYDSIVPHLLSSISEGLKARVLSILYTPAY